MKTYVLQSCGRHLDGVALSSGSRRVLEGGGGDIVVDLQIIEMWIGFVCEP